MPRIALVAIALVAVAAGVARFSAPGSADVDRPRSAEEGAAVIGDGVNFGATDQPADNPPVTLPAPLIGAPGPAADADEPVLIKSPPRVVRIPSIEVDATVIDLGLEDDGALETPQDYDLAGWWAGGTTANEDGPTVIVGHVDDYTGPAVFYRLDELRLGDEIEVVDSTGTTTRFVVTERATYDKDDFPTEKVYGETDEPTLRLITCGGTFDRSLRSYEANVVIYAEPV